MCYMKKAVRYMKRSWIVILIIVLSFGIISFLGVGLVRNEKGERLYSQKEPNQVLKLATKLQQAFIHKSGSTKQSEQPSSVISSHKVVRKPRTNASVNSNKETRFSRSKGDGTPSSKCASPPRTSISTEVVVYGGGTSGVFTAYQLAKMGHHVVIIEPTEWLGGQTSAAGVSTLDTGVRDIVKFGLIPDWISAVRNYYRNRSGDDTRLYAMCYWDYTSTPGVGNICPDPTSAREAFNWMVASAIGRSYITVLTNTDIERESNPIVWNNGRISGIIVRNEVACREYVINAKIVIDASEYGDLIPYTGALFYVGEGGPFASRSQALRWAQNHAHDSLGCMQDITYVALMRKLPYIPMRFNTLNTFSDYVVLGDMASTCWDYRHATIYPWTFMYHARYRAVGDPLMAPRSYQCSGYRVRIPTKFAINSFNDTPTSALFLLDLQYRHNKICEAKHKTWQWVNYLGNLSASASIGDLKGFYLSHDANFCPNSNCYSLRVEGCSAIPDDIEKYFATIPYVRESIRIAGKFGNKKELTVSDIKREQSIFKDAVSVGAYAFDLHGCGSGRYPWVTGLYQLPIRVFFAVKPNGEYLKGFLVAEKNLAVDRYVQGSIRVQPTVMLSGQAVGVISAVMLRHNDFDPAHINIREVQDILTSGTANMKISPYVFKDINYTQYSSARKFSELMSAYNIMIGDPYGNWMPFSNFTRAQTAVILKRIAKVLGYDLRNFKVRSYDNRFVDINGHWGFNFIKTIYEADLTDGCDSSHFCPDRHVTLNQIGVFLERLYRLLGVVGNSNYFGCTVRLPAGIADWARPFWVRLVTSRKVLDVDGTCRVNILKEICGSSPIGEYTNCQGGRVLTRVEAAEVIWETLKNIVFLPN